MDHMGGTGVGFGDGAAHAVYSRSTRIGPGGKTPLTP